MVFESMVSDLLNRFIGDYVENLDKSQLRIGIWGGKENGMRSANVNSIIRQSTSKLANECVRASSVLPWLAK